MSRYLVPIAGATFVVGLAAVLIWKIVLLSPDTHAHLWDTLHPGYTRTAPILVGAGPVGDVELSLPTGHADEGDPETNDQGRAVYLTMGCSTCHGLEAQGGPVGPSLAGSSYDVVERMVREGRGGMPAYLENHLGAADIAELAAYLGGLIDTSSNPEEIAAIQRLVYDPATPREVLLQGKAAIRRSCGACHAQPDREDLDRAFQSDAEATGLVAEMLGETNLSLEDATAIAHYILSTRHGTDPVKTP